MKVRYSGALVAILLAGAACARAQSPAWHVGAAGGVSRSSLPCEEGLACDRSGGAWKVSAGFEWPNETGGEVIYEDFGIARAGGLGALELTEASVRARGFGVAAVWHPAIGGGLSAKVKIGASSIEGRTKGMADGVAIDTVRTTAPHWWLASGLAWRVAEHWSLTADFDWTRVGYYGNGHKETSDVGAFTFGAAVAF